MATKEYYTIDEAAEYLGLTRDAIYQIVARKLITYTKPEEDTARASQRTSQRIYISHDELIRYIEGRICKASRTAEQQKPSIAKMIAQIEGYISVLDALLVRLNNWNRIIDNLNKNKIKKL